MAGILQSVNSSSSLFIPPPTTCSTRRMLTSSNVLHFSSNSPRLINISRRFSSIVATVSSTPTAPTPEKAITPEKTAKWSFRFIKSFAMGELEARKLKFNNTGTESLLMGILVEGTSLAAKLLRESGVTLFKVREETVKILGKSDMYIFSPEHPPLTEPAQKAIDWAINEKLKSGETGEVTTSHLLLGIWAQKESAGHKIMATLGFNDDKANELSKSMDKEIILSYKRGL